MATVETRSNPPLSPFEKGEVSFQASNPLGKREEGEIFVTFVFVVRDRARVDSRVTSTDTITMKLVIGLCTSHQV